MVRRRSESGARALAALLLGPGRAAALQAAAATGMVEALRGGASAAQLALRTGLPPTSIEILIKALRDARLVALAGSRFRWRLGAAETELLPAILDLTVGSSWPFYARLAAIASGRSDPSGWQRLAGRSWLARRAVALGVVASASADPAARLLRATLGRAPRRWLDVGAGSGALSRALLARFPRARATLLDRAEVIRWSARAERLRPARLRWRAGDWARVDWGRGYDAVLLSQVIGEADVELLLTNAAAALRCGGVLLVHDTFRSRTGYGLALELSAFAVGAARPPDAGALRRALRRRRFRLVGRHGNAWSRWWAAVRTC
jgi:SAM-dependent methyltransferase